MEKNVGENARSGNMVNVALIGTEGLPAGIWKRF